MYRPRTTGITAALKRHRQIEQRIKRRACRAERTVDGTITASVFVLAVLAVVVSIIG